MKYQLLLLIIYLITIAYGEDKCTSYKTSETCSADKTNNCKWTGKAASCAQKTSVTCTSHTTSATDCTNAGACTYNELGTCANSKDNAACTAAAATCADTAGCTGDSNGCTAETGQCNYNTKTTCEAQTTAHACAWTKTSATCTDACASITSNTDCTSNSGCSWTEGTGSCATSNSEEKKDGDDSGSDSSNYVKFGNYLLVLFLFLF